MSLTILGYAIYGNRYNLSMVEAHTDVVHLYIHWYFYYLPTYYKIIGVWNVLTFF